VLPQFHTDVYNLTLVSEQKLNKFFIEGSLQTAKTNAIKVK